MVVKSIHFPCSGDHEQDWQPYPVDPYSAICDDHTYIYKYIYTHSVKATVYKTIVKIYLSIRSDHPRLLVRYCVSVNQKGLMTCCVNRKKCVLMLFDVCMYLDGRGVD